MTVFFLILSIMSTVAQNCIFNKVSKKELSTNNHIYYFNTFISLVCIFLFGILLLREKMSLFTALIGIIFGVMTALRNVYNMQTLANGPMNITILITTSSTIIPTLSGVFFGEPFSIMKLIAVIFLIGFIYISLDKDSNTKINKKWIVFATLTFLTQGTIGVLQKVHQTSVYKNEASGFLFIAFILAYIYNRLRMKGNVKELNFQRKHILFAYICGLCTFCMNYLNLKLSGILPSQLFFPLVNGGSMVLNQIMAVLIFKEIPTKKQLVGLVGGICSLIAICLV
ncbi:MAG: EamA family transporter [Clostridia bacterium]|nr:EamA family transporter [Clostridia bacterium]